MVSFYCICTLRTDINVRSGINVRAGNLGENNKRMVWNKRAGGKLCNRLSSDFFDALLNTGEIETSV